MPSDARSAYGHAFHPAELPEHGRLFVYGTGAGGSAMARLLSHRGLPPAAFIDTHREGWSNGVPIMTIDAYASRRLPDDLVLICSSFAAEIRGELDRRGIAAINATELASSLVAETERFARVVAKGAFSLTV